MENFEDWLPTRKNGEPRIARRSPLEVCFDVLRVISENQPVRPTQVMYRSNLSWTVMQCNVKRLIERELVEKVHARYDGRALLPGGERWSFLRLTPKGVQALSSFNEGKLAVGRSLGSQVGSSYGNC